MKGLVRKAALKAMVNLVRKNGGRIASIRRDGQTFIWTSPDGRRAGIGWA